ncbi:hypothetical protein JOD57_001675 [Geodermatophilus bullaregiensis]|uniref:hypothetical protein n=1 Tax=Geodermatophilus bullaregiensis TaxID=1564160 RepID=UPI0019596D57|nr:hypothetical protein [Geodermatophilus bullaregiensis]MBM7805838.1 hypothetical protein [Geodermatophilus bullaregiensis]
MSCTDPRQPQAHDAAANAPQSGRQRVVLHVGTPKSGTTYLQELLWASRPALAEAGVLYPGEHPGAHFHAVLDAQQRSFHGHVDPGVAGAWDRIVAAARDHQGTTVVSHELFGDLSGAEAARALADLDFAEVHVVVTVRDLARQLPAVWQEDVKNRHALPFADFLDMVRPGSDRPDEQRPAADTTEGHAEAFWLRHDVPAVLRRWAAGLPAEQVHVVTVPPQGADPALLWERFAAVVGVDPAVATQPDGRRNQSLGRAESELLRRLNERLDYGVEWPLYAARITHHLAVGALAGRPGSARLTLPAGERAWVSAAADAVVAELAALDCTVTGDLEDLRVPARGRDDDRPADLAELLDAALDAIAALIPVGPPPAPQPAPEPAPAGGPVAVAQPVAVPEPAAVAEPAVPVLPQPRLPGAHVVARAGRDRGARLWRRVVGARALPPRPAADAPVETAGV